MKEKPELLAPAGSWDALVAAVSAGADAVYLGGRRFGARAMAPNFDDELLRRAVNYAHLRGVKVYVTVNTLIHDDELPDVADYLISLYEMGADAVLVQDPGIAALAGELVPDLDIHASTQMTVHNREGAIWAAHQGMKRVVLARELSLKEVEEMACAGTGLEIFVHGALCYCYSGQCLLSEVMGGRSGNRGVCAQPCRKPYQLLAGKADGYGRPVEMAPLPLEERYLMSTRDLCLYRHLDRLAASPVKSLKIEGRMRSPEYVYTVVDIYRRALDAAASGKWSASEEDVENLALAFNRGFTRGYLMGARGRDLMGRDRPDNRGLFIGTVESIRPGGATLRLAGGVVPEAGDGLVFCHPSGTERGLVLRRPPGVRGQRAVISEPGDAVPGSEVWLTRRADLDRRAQKAAVAGRALEIPLDLKVSWEEGVPVIEASTKGPSGPLKGLVRGDPMEKALKRPLDQEQIEAQLCKTGGTPFAVRRVEMNYPGGLFAPLSSVNKLRRDLLEAVVAGILNAFCPDEGSVASARGRHKALKAELARKPGSALDLCEGRRQTISVYADDLETAMGAAEGGCDRVYFEPTMRLLPDVNGDLPDGEGMGAAEAIMDAAAACRRFGAELVWKWPRITRRRYLDAAVPLLARVREAGLSEVMVEGVGAAEAVLRAVPGMRVSGSSGLNVWNHRSALLLSATFSRLTLSPELSARQIEVLAARAREREDCPPLELLVQGNLEVVVSEDCLPRTALGIDPGIPSTMGLKDSTGRVFPIRVDGEGRTHVYNAVETCLVDQMAHLRCLDSLAIDARGRGRDYAREMAAIYKEAMVAGADLKALKEKARKMSRGGITTGPFLKGLRS